MKKTSNDLPAACPCDRLDAAQRRPLAYAACCGRYIEASADETADCTVGAPDAESLMRSRYTAFVLRCESYLRATWDAAHVPATLDLDPAVKWLGLEVRDHRRIDDSHAEVEFVARYRVDGRAVRLHERSRFVRREGRWLYVDGDQR